jgi:uncharacterized membrane protein
MTLTRRGRKVALAVHVTVSVGWVGAVLAYVALGVVATTSARADDARAAWLAMEIVGWSALVPLALASLGTGLLMSLGTKWGLLRHYWVLISFALTAFATAVLVLHMPDVSAVAEQARTASAEELHRLGGDLFHAVGGLVVLLTVLGLNIAKPAGLTRYGWNRRGNA